MAYGIVKYPLKNDEPNTFDAGPEEGSASAPKPASDLQINALRVAAVSLQEHAGFEQYFASVASVPLRTAPSGLSRCFGVPPLFVLKFLRDPKISDFMVFNPKTIPNEIQPLVL